MKTTFLLLFVTIAMMVYGCSSSSNDDRGRVALQFQVPAQSGTAFGTLDATGSNQTLESITEVKLFIDEMELESTQGDSLDFEIEKFVLNLPLDGGSIRLTDRFVPAGFYDEFELEIEKPDSPSEVNDPDFIGDDGTRYSLIVRGVFDGESFLFRSTEDFEIEIDVSPPLQVTEDGQSILVIEIDVFSWFRDSSGNELDPRNPSNSEAINSRIEQSFEAFEDRFDDDDDD